MNRAVIALLLTGAACRKQAPKVTPASRAKPTAARRSVATPMLAGPLTLAEPTMLAEPPTTASLWAAAASSNTPESWVAAATALQDDLAGCTEDCLFLAHEVVDAWNRAERLAGEASMDVHANGPVPPISAAWLAAMDTYVSLSSPSDPDVEHFQLMAAATLDYRDQLAAIPRLEAFVDTYRDESDRSLVATWLIDSLIRNGRRPELQRVVAALLADPAGLDQDVQARLASIQAQLAAGQMPAAEG